jgi:hypothetical protein
MADCCYLVKIENEIELADVSKESIENLDKEVDGFEVGELVVVSIDAQAKEESCIATVHNLEVAELILQ